MHGKDLNLNKTEDENVIFLRKYVYSFTCTHVNSLFWNIRLHP